MPCGGIYPIRDANPNWKCFFCNQKGCDHFCDEWDCGLHAACVIPFLHTEEGEVVLGHKHHIQINGCLLQPEDGELMDPNETLRQLRVALAAMEMEPNEENAELVLNLFDNLDGWLKMGGFPPTDWKKDG